MRLAFILLDPKHRGSVANLMTNKKGRKEADQSVDPKVAFFEKILEEDFLNREYKVTIPASLYEKLEEEEAATWDPNDDVVLKVRNAEWLIGTWLLYVKKKYKTALDRWNKLTGGGDGSPESFTTTVVQTAG